MALALQPRERLSVALRRAATEQLDEAIARLDVLPRRDDDAFHRSVHTSRKSMKKARGLLRLVRDDLGTERYRRENGRLRDTARRLSAARDAAVLRGTLEGVSAELPDGLAARIDAVLAERQRLATRHLIVSVTIDRALAELRSAREDIATWGLDEDGFDLIAKGLRRTYRRGARALAVVQGPEVVEQDDRGSEAWHEWRKRAKYLWYQLRLLQPTSPIVDSLVAEADELGELLGDDHDLAVLRALVLSDPDAFGSADEVRPLVTALDVRSDELRRPALELGRRLYLDEPDAFTHRLSVHWRAWSLRPPEVPSAQTIADGAPVA